MIKRHIITFGKDSVMAENFSDTGNNQKMYVVHSDVSYDKSKDPSKHISLGGIKSLFEDFNMGDGKTGEVNSGKFISSVSVTYFDEGFNTFRKIIIHNSPTLLNDLENFISSLEGSTKNTTTIIIFNGGDMILNLREEQLENCVFSRYNTSFPIPLLNRPDLFPRKNDGSFKDFNVSYILVTCSRSKKMLFDSFKLVPKLNLDSTSEMQIATRKKYLNELYIKMNEDKPPIIDTKSRSNTKETVEYLNVFGLSSGRYVDDMIAHPTTKTGLIATIGKEIKYYKEHVEVENTR